MKPVSKVHIGAHRPAEESLSAAPKKAAPPRPKVPPGPMEYINNPYHRSNFQVSVSLLPPEKASPSEKPSHPKPPPPPRKKPDLIKRSAAQMFGKVAGKTVVAKNEEGRARLQTALSRYHLHHFPDVLDISGSSESSDSKSGEEASSQGERNSLLSRALPDLPESGQ